MTGKPLARIQLQRQAIRERRGGRRDRRILEATMKYSGEFIPVEVADVSDHGAYIVCPALPNLSDSVTLNIDLPHLGCSVMISGRVRRVGLSSRALSRPTGFGVEFTRFYSSSGQQSLQSHLAA